MDRFVLLERIGSGGMGTVYRGFDQRLQREVAVKEIAGSDPERVAREAQAAARLNHPGIVTLYELGSHRGQAVLVSEYVEGETLGELRRSGALHDREVGEVALSLCDALAHAHARGVVHRDIKPENVIVCDRDDACARAKLMDFGIARISGSPTLSATGEIVGTLAYMSPEQADGEAVGPPSDVYSLALVIFECFAGENPVAAPTPAATVRRIDAGVPSLREYRPDLPEGLTDVLDACLSSEAHLRPDAAALGECIDAELVALDPDRLLPLPADAATGGERRRLDLGRLSLLAAGLGALAILAGPLGAGGAALVLGVLLAPLVVLGAPGGGLAVLLAPVLASIGAATATAALGAAGKNPLARAVLGATVWCWIFTAAVGYGAGSTLGIAPEAPPGWTADPGLAADWVLAPLLEPEALLGALVFAVAALALGWMLRPRHAALALLGAMLWAAGVEAVLARIGTGELGGHPALLVGAGALAVAFEYGFSRADHAPRSRDPAVDRDDKRLFRGLAGGGMHRRAL